MSRSFFSLSRSTPTFVGSLGFAAVSLSIVNYTASEVYIRVGDNLDANPTSYHYLVAPATSMVIPINHAQALSIRVATADAGSTPTGLTDRVDIIAVDESETPPLMAAAELQRKLGQRWDFVAPQWGSDELIIDTRRGHGLIVTIYVQAQVTRCTFVIAVGESDSGPWQIIKNVQLDTTYDLVPLQIKVPVVAPYTSLHLSNPGLGGGGVLSGTVFYDVLAEPGPVRNLQSNDYDIVVSGGPIANGNILPIPPLQYYGANRTKWLDVDLIGVPTDQRWFVTIEYNQLYGLQTIRYVLTSYADLAALFGGTLPVTSPAELVTPADPYCTQNRFNYKSYRLPLEIRSLQTVPGITATFYCGTASFSRCRMILHGEYVK